MNDSLPERSRPWGVHMITVGALALTALGLREMGASSVVTLGALVLVGVLGAFLHLRRRAAPGGAARIGARAPGVAGEGRAPAVVAPDARSASAERELLEIVPVALLAYDHDGHIVLANAMARELFFEGCACVGRNFLGLLRSAPPTVREAIGSGVDAVFDVELDGAQETFHLSRRYVERPDGPWTLLVVRRLTRELSRREVEVLKGVIRVLSHELNNSLAPMTSLVHSARLLAKGPNAAEKLERVFDTIEERARHLQSFLEGYAKLARLPRPQPRGVVWGPWLGQLSALYPDISVGQPPATDGWLDPVLIEQVLINLVKNSLEAGSAPADVSLEIGERDGGFELSVLDRGSGMDTDTLKSATLPFYTTKKAGTGLGLALCREIVEAHGGDLRVHAREGGGTVVRAWLPGRGSSSRTARLTLSTTLDAS